MSMAEGRVSYAGYRLIDVVVRSERERAFLESLPEDRGEVRGIDVWTNDGVLVADGQTVNRVMVSADGYKAMVKSGLFGHAVVITHDMEKRIAQRSVRDAKPKSQRNTRADVYDPHDEWYYHWHSYDDIQERLQMLAKNYSSMMNYFAIGESHEGRKIGVLNIKGRNPTRQVALIGGTHAREWMAEGTLLWALGCITELYGQDKNLTQAIDSLDLYICPCYNPDGYTYTRDTEPLWRKNRRDNGDGTFGVDQNRNWDVDWGRTFSSHDTSSLIYCGPSALSEPEPLAMHNFLQNLPNLTSVIDVHNPEKGFMRPFAYTNSSCPDEDELSRFGFEFIKQIYMVHGTKFRSLRASEIYAFSGGCVDRAYLLGARKSFVFELYGDFTPPESEIQNQGEEAFAGIRYFLSNV